MTVLAIIGGTGLTSLETLKITHRELVSTPYGEPSGPLIYGELCDKPVVFLARHGQHHTIPPHKINYRANVWALKQIGVEKLIAIAAVGGIGPEMAPGCLAFPEQIIDYTWGRKHTFYEDNLTHVTHIDFTHPYCETLRADLMVAARQAALEAREYGTYAATQGPRLETAAEICRLERDGCDLVGMTGMPEAALAREIGLSYATCAVIANWAAGKSEEEITMEVIQQQLVNGMDKVKLLLHQVISQLA
ncbi:MAG: S-methyl-5'-thioinosine phosphorylase [Candidatus Competibacteraceae bacterium]|jgi:5'-methylthioinosine phosphorylase|nr:S-methyl-5'-thioinosine phosphorylase [Candidatus Competibacteraceae bacterium]